MEVALIKNKMEQLKKILVVDDDADIRNVINFILTSEGYQVKELADGHDVDFTIADSRPDVILLDVMLGDMDGRDICRMLKEAPATKEIPIIIVSATHASIDHEKGCHADDYLPKPFDIDILLQKVNYYSAA
ncbi:response regulator transcription factor [Mucilaginibacter sp. SMC90]|uniref:response regulator transcription factor n=1 Tax=Mucilaginibacter sp. SMC90 TaxID=2929803 RepID=UPI001FB22F1B|nr:response regulator transcription factor [Mucilaginibacter sp. SMC90]UOE47414.1 response regulator transcription factor [Mucilaginibacter sp. SMC90]